MARNRHIDEAVEFRTVMGQPVGTDDFDTLFMQWKLIDEEFQEFSEAEVETENHLKELADLAYVCYQYAAAKGWDLDEALHRVHESNMSKLVNGKPLRRADGKVLKGPNYQPPNLSDLL